MSRQPEWTVVLLGTSLSIVCGLGRGDWAVRYQTVLRCNCPVGVPSFASPFHNKRVTGHRAEGRPTKSEVSPWAQMQRAVQGGHLAVGVGGRRTGQRSDPTEPVSAGTAAPKWGGAGHHQLAQLALHHLLQRMCEVQWALADMELKVGTYLKVPNSEVLLGLPKGNGCPEDREQRAVSAALSYRLLACLIASVSFHSTSTRSLNVKTSLGASNSDSLSAVSTDKAREPK
ncbi:hypothetical protein CCHR01_10289 [Colletotrichum chrysophilum]|uniref:Uncharacterized protein n=1 Tax=Colletotrichum chrysophilum TaxID=1836956 RepID=A0AAD9EJH7_9PEZI|nr:hypothetical protein CCHR01_10289 [Colletotrichum chrysophilum]